MNLEEVYEILSSIPIGQWFRYKDRGGSYVSRMIVHPGLEIDGIQMVTVDLMSREEGVYEGVTEIIRWFMPAITIDTFEFLDIDVENPIKNRKKRISDII